jgi:hypothetical protein
MSHPTSAAQSATLGMLLELHPALVDIDALAARLQLPELTLELAVSELVEAGLARRLGGRLGLTRAATQFDALSRS